MPANTPASTDSSRESPKWGVGIAAACLSGIDFLPLCASIGAVAGYIFPLAAVAAMAVAGSSPAESLKVASTLLSFWNPHSAMIGAAIGAAGGLCAGAFQAYGATCDAIFESIDDPQAPQTFLQKLSERRRLVADELGLKTKKNTFN